MKWAEKVLRACNHPAKTTAFGCCYLLLQKAFALLWVMIPQNEESEPSDEMASVQGVYKT